MESCTGTFFLGIIIIRPKYFFMSLCVVSIIITNIGQFYVSFFAFVVNGFHFFSSPSLSIEK
ncbi:unnamed protein product [Ixodes pacificus]